jgi:putative aldouronate transport system substrate-binding protein
MKRLMSVIICLLLMVSMLAACTTASEKNNNSTTGAAASTTKATEAVTTAAEEPVTISFFGVDVRAAEGFFLKDNLWVWEELGKRLNQKYVFNTNNNYHDMVNVRLFSGEKLEDLFCIGYNDPQKPSGEGIFLPLEDLIAKYAPNIAKAMSVNPNIKLANSNVANGKMYTFSETTFKCMDNDVLLYLARKDWFDKLNLKAPETVDELFNVLMAIKKGDPNGNGKADEIPFVCDAFGDIKSMLAMSFGLHQCRNEGIWADNGKVYMEITTDNYKQMLMYYNKLYINGLVPADIQNYTWETNVEMCAKNVVGVDMALYGSVEGAMGSFLAGDPNAKALGFLPPKGADGKRTIEKPYTEYKRYAITKYCEHPEAVMKLLDYLYSDEGWLLYNYGIEGEDYKMINGEPAATDKIAKAENPSAEYEKRGMQIQIIPRIYTPITKAMTNLRPKEVQEPYSKMYDHLVDGLFLRKLPRTGDESTVVNNEDLKTYILTSEVEFVTGKRSFDKWDDFQAQLTKYGLDKVAATYQAVYDRNYKK